MADSTLVQENILPLLVKIKVKRLIVRWRLAPLEAVSARKGDDIV